MGVQSIVRENIILDALDKEFEADRLFRMASVESAILPLLNQSGVQRGFSKAVNLVQAGCALSQNQDSGTIHRAMRALTMSSPDEAMAAFQLLKSTPVYGELLASLKAAEDEGLLTPDR